MTEKDMNSVEDIIKARVDVIDVLKRLKTEKTEIEASIEDLAKQAITLTCEQQVIKERVKVLKTQRKKKLGPSTVEYNKKKEKIEKLEMSLQTQNRSLPQERKMLERIKAMRTELKNFQPPKEATEIHNTILSDSKTLDEIYHKTQKLISDIAMVSITMDGLLTKRMKMETKFSEMTEEIKKAYAGKRRTKKEIKTEQEIQQEVDGLLSRLKEGETLNIEDLLGAF